MPTGHRKRLVLPLLLGAVGLCGLAATPAVRATVPVEFPGPVVVPTSGATSAGCVVPGIGGAPSRFLVGTGNGYVELVVYQAFLDGFRIEGSILLGGVVTSVAIIPNAAGAVDELVVALADPDRLVFLDLASAAPYFSVRDEIALSEDPGDVVALPAADGTVSWVAVALPGIDRIETAERDGAGWRAGAGLDAGDRPQGLAAADLDADGAAELVAANEGALSHSLHVFRVDGGGPVFDHEFVMPVTPIALTVTDWGNDGREELIVLAADTTLAWQVSAAAGLLTLDRTIPLRVVADGLDAARLLDGRLGLYLCSRARGLVEVLTFDGSSWQAGDVYYPSCRPRLPLAAELNADARVDLVSIGGDLEATTVMYGDDDNGLHGYPVLSLSGSPGSAAMGDLDRDGEPDVVVGIVDGAALDTFDGHAGGLLAAPRHQTLPFAPGAMQLLQADADPEPELAVVSIFDGTVRILHRDPVGDFQAGHTIALGVAGLQLGTADVDGDGHQDLFYLTSASPEIRICFGAGDGTFPTIIAESFLWQARGITTVDLDGDGDRELVGTDGFGRVAYRSNEGGRSFGTEVRINADSGSRQLVLADLDGDLDEDIIVVNIDAESLTLLENDGAGALVRRIGSYALAGRPAGALAEDVNQDGLIDLIVNRRNEGQLGIHFGLGNWTYTEAQDFTGGSDVSIFMSEDLNGDTVPDLLTLDESLELGLTMLNVERVIVANEPRALSTDCRDGDLLVAVRPGDLADWSLQVRTGDRWRQLAGAGGATAGDLRAEGAAWSLRLSPAELADAGLGGGFEARLAGPDGADDLTRLRVAPCGDTPGTPAPLSWTREPWPNPFNPLVHARIRLERPARITAGIYDLQGRLVARLLAEQRPAGELTLSWDGRDGGHAAAAGLYLLRVTSDRTVLTRKLTLLK